MKFFANLISVILLASACLADSASPYGANLLSDIGNLEINAEQWTLTNNVLSKKSCLYFGDKFLVVKANVVAIPAWYALRCDLINMQKQNDKLPEAGLVFGFVDERNYWSLLVGEDLACPFLKLVHVKEGVTVAETSVPLSFQSDQKGLSIALEVHHGAYVKAYANNSLVLIHKVSDGFPRGRVGLTLQTGMCGFTNATMSGIAKR